MQDNERKFEVKLPARITGLVFWALVFVGLLIAIIILQQVEKDLISENHKEALVLAYEIEEIAEQFSEPPVLERAAGRIRAKILQRMEKFDLQAVDLYDGNSRLSVGTGTKEDDLYEYTLHYFPKNSSEVNTISLEIYSTNSKKTIAELRKRILLSIGFGVLIFGFVLQRSLQKLLADPFHNMVTTAEQFSLGNENVRFNEAGGDEFGYLGKFINNAIDTILKNKNELVLALDRASSSETALNIEKERAEVTLSSITDTVVTVDVDLNIVYLNPAGEKLLGQSNSEISGKAFNEVFKIIDENTDKEIVDPLKQCVDSGEIITLPEHSSLTRSDESMVSIEASIAPMKSDENELIGVVMVIQDVSQTRSLNRQLSYQASHDLLTGLYNRRKFEEYLEELLIDTREEDRHHTLFYLDLDDFKVVNDTCGHVAGDELLKQLPALFHETLRTGDTVARLGGDEFGIILQNCSVEQATIIAEKIREKIKSYRFIWEDRTFEIGVSIGVVGIDAENSEMSYILSSADMACYAAKDAGRNRVHVYKPSDEAITERFGQMHWASRISTALEKKKFKIYQQPIVGLSGENSHHQEILVRMVDEDDNIVLPGAFMSAAERYGLMHEIDRWVIREVFQHMGRDDPADPVKGTNRIFFINLSGDSINERSLLNYILQEKDKYEVSLENVCFELSENTATSNLSKTAVFIKELKKHNCKFSLDSFGNGLSSFSYLKAMPVDYIKINGDFVKNISTDELDRAMVESILKVARILKLSTIAEHVENNENLVALKEIGVDYVQGYYLGRPEVIEVP